MKEVLVLGVGNRLMMDDGVGVYVVEALRRKNTNPNIRYSVGETDIYFCLQQIEETSYTIIVDAAYHGNKPGGIITIQLQQVLSTPIQSISIHEAHLLNEIKPAGKNIEGMFIGIEPYEIDYCLGLSPILQVQFSRIIDDIRSLIEACML